MAITRRDFLNGVAVTVAAGLTLGQETTRLWRQRSIPVACA